MFILATLQDHKATHGDKSIPKEVEEKLDKISIDLDKACKLLNGTLNGIAGDLMDNAIEEQVSFVEKLR